ncbi:unnamed protein product, partial [Meganyctiphanes norvegica]
VSAVEGKSAARVRAALGRQADPNTTCRWTGNKGTTYNTPVLRHAVALLPQCEEVVVALLESGSINPDLHGDHPNSPLLAAVIIGNSSIAELLLRKGASPNLPSGGKPLHTPLIQAALDGHVNLCRLLLNYGASPGATNSEGFHAVYNAAQNNHRDVIEVLLSYGADPQQMRNVLFGFGKTPASHASYKGHTELSSWLQTQRKQPEREAKGLLVRAVKGGDAPGVIKALKQGANPNPTPGATYNGEPLLCTAALGGNLDICSQLLQKGAVPSATDSDGCHALYLAAKGGHLQIIELLVQKGVDPEGPCSDTTQTAASIARDKRHLELVAWLDNHRLMTQGARYTNKHGRVILLNYVEFNDIRKNRKGAEEDNEVLRDTFEKFEGKYEVFIYDNLTSEETITKMKEHQKDTSLDTVDSFIVFICSHGKSKHEFYTRNGEMNINELRALMLETSDGCLYLQGKPKIWFANYCQGKAVEEDFDMDVEPSPEFPVISERGKKERARISVPRNIKTFFATSEGAVAWRHHDGGNYFLQTFCTLLKTNPNLELQQLVFKTNEVVEAQLIRKNTFSEEGSRFNHFYF